MTTDNINLDHNKKLVVIVVECLQMKGTLEGETILPWKDFDWHFQKLFVSTGEREWKPRRQIYNQIAAKKDKC